MDLQGCLRRIKMEFQTTRESRKVVQVAWPKKPKSFGQPAKVNKFPWLLKKKKRFQGNILFAKSGFARFYKRCADEPNCLRGACSPAGIFWRRCIARHCWGIAKQFLNPERSESVRICEAIPESEQSEDAPKGAPGQAEGLASASWACSEAECEWAPLSKSPFVELTLTPSLRCTGGWLLRRGRARQLKMT